MLAIPAGPITRILWATTYAVANTAYTIAACTIAGHPRSNWPTDDVRICKCGAKWSKP